MVLCSRPLDPASGSSGRTMDSKFTAIAVATAANVISAFPVRAQERVGSDGPQVATVTAQTRSATVLEIPYCNSAASGADLENRQIDDLGDITRAVAGVYFGAGRDAGMESITMRGISSVDGGATAPQCLDDVSILRRISFELAAPRSEGVRAQAASIGAIDRLPNLFPRWRCVGAVP